MSKFHFKFLADFPPCLSRIKGIRAIESMIRKATSAFGALNEVWTSKISKKAKIAVYRSLIIPKALYSAETIMTNKESDNQLDIFERRCLRTIYGIKMLDKVTNEELYQATRAETGKWTPLSEEFRRARLRYLGHVLRMEEGRTPSIALREAFAEKPTSRPRGRPKCSWTSTINATSS
jgi:hypothetical protein